MRDPPLPARSRTIPLCPFPRVCARARTGALGGSALVERAVWSGLRWWWWWRGGVGGGVIRVSDARAAGHHALIVRACESRRQTKVRPPRTFCARCIQASVFFHLPLALTQPPPPSCTGCAGVCLSLYVRQIRVRAPGNRMHVNIIFCIYIILYVNIYNIIYIYIYWVRQIQVRAPGDQVSQGAAHPPHPRGAAAGSQYTKSSSMSPLTGMSMETCPSQTLAAHPPHPRGAPPAENILPWTYGPEAPQKPVL